MKVTYDQLSEIFYYENKKNRLNFSKLISGRKGSAIDIPCASGIRLCNLAEKYNIVYACDKSENMVNYARNNNQAFKNLNFKVLNLKEISKIKHKVNDVFVMEYALHFLKKHELEKFCKDIKNICKNIFIELYDYNSINLNIIKESFYVNNDYVELTKKYKLQGEQILIQKCYIINNNKILEQEILLYYYKIEKIIKIFQKNGFMIKSIYSNYNLLLEKNNPRKIIVFENKLNIL